MLGHESDGIVGGEGRKELEVAKGNRAVTKGRMVGRGPVGSRRGRHWGQTPIYPAGTLRVLMVGCQSGWDGG